MSSPFSSSAQTAFFTEGYQHLHHLVLDLLSEPDSPHLVLPLLQVSRYWRAFVRDYLLDPYKKTTVKKGGRWDPELRYPCPQLTEGAFVKFYLTSYNPYDGAHKDDDPRYYFSKAGRHSPCVYLLFQSCDPITHICTFVPAIEANEDPETNPYMGFDFQILCVVETREPQIEIVPSFGLVPSTWFVPERSPKSGLWGKEVAFDREAFPSPSPFVWSPMPQKPGEGEGIQPNERKGWSVDFGVVRVDHEGSRISADDRDFGFYPASAIMMFRTAEIPLASLYRPYGLRKSKTYYGSEDEEEYDW